MNSQYFNDLDLINEAREYLYKKSLPFPITGIAFIPKDMIIEVDDHLSMFKERFHSRGEEFIYNYKAYIELARTAPGDVFNPEDYPGNVTRKFDFSWSFFEIEAPNGKARILTPAIYEREKEKFERMMEDFQNTGISTLREKFAEMVSHLVERLTDEKKVFKNSSINNFKEFLEDFRKLNINDHQEIAALVTKCQGLISGDLEAQDLRDNTGLRKRIAEQMEQVKGSLDVILTQRLIRKIVRD